MYRQINNLILKLSSKTLDEVLMVLEEYETKQQGNDYIYSDSDYFRGGLFIPAAFATITCR